VLQLRVVGGQAKFKVGPAVPAARKREVGARLRDRDLPGDRRAADLIESSLPAAEHGA
jgi:hypothetical protein